MILHLIQRSPFSSSVLDDCLDIADSSDALLLMEDGVYGIQHSDIPKDKDVYALQEDVEARGITIQANSDIKLCNYDDFVSLTTQYNQVISWF